MAAKTTNKRAQKKLPTPQQWLAAVLKQVPTHGWSMGALERAAKQLSVDAALIRLVFPAGVKDVVQLFHDDAQETMAARIAAFREFKHLRVNEKINFAVKTRLQAMDKHREAVRRLYGWATLPGNAPLGMKLVWDACDAMWHAAGDTATDYNHYTKRLLLAQVYQRTLMVWLDDISKGSAKTWTYLDARIAEVLVVGRKIGQVKDMLKMAGSVVKSRFAA